MKQNKVYFLGPAVVFVLLLMLPVPGMAGEQRLRENILALDRIKNSLEAEHGQTTDREKRELLIFADFLEERIREYCRQLAASAGVEAIRALPCPEPEVAMPPMTARTVEEQLSELDRALDASLGEFDDMLLEEQERIAARRPLKRAQSGSAADAEGRGGATGKQGREGVGQPSRGQSSPGTVNGNPEPGQQARTSRAGSRGQTSSSSGRPTTAGRPRSNTMNTDDDIVARQLREAAEKETDPELKEKLWEEYRKYKRGE